MILTVRDKQALVQFKRTLVFHEEEGFQLHVRPKWWKMIKKLRLITNSAWQASDTSCAQFQYPIRRLIVRSHKVSKPRYLYLELSGRSEIWQTPRQQGCRGACQISKRYDNLNYQSRGFETSRDLTIRRLIGYCSSAPSGMQRLMLTNRPQIDVASGLETHKNTLPFEQPSTSAPGIVAVMERSANHRPESSLPPPHAKNKAQITALFNTLWARYFEHYTYLYIRN